MSSCLKRKRKTMEVNCKLSFKPKTTAKLADRVSRLWADFDFEDKLAFVKCTNIRIQDLDTNRNKNRVDFKSWFRLTNPQKQELIACALKLGLVQPR